MRRNWLLGGAAAIAGIAALALLTNTLRLPGVGASPGASGPASNACTAATLRATVGGWEGAAGHRIGTMSVTNTGGAPCLLSGALRPSLIDRNGTDLIVGKPVDGQSIEIRPGFTVVAMVQTGNYCGPTAQEPVAVALQLAPGGRLVARPISGDESSGLPPCMGEAGPTDDITIQPWIATMQG